MKIEERPISTLHENHFVVSKIIEFPADDVWRIVAEEYGDQYRSNPFVFHSEWIGWDTTVQDGARRLCHFAEDGSKQGKERMVNVDKDAYTFTTQVFEAKGIEADPGHSGLTYRITPLFDTACRLEMEVQSKTLPAFVGTVKRELFEEMVKGYMLGIEYHLKTGEDVTFHTGKKLLRALD